MRRRTGSAWILLWAAIGCGSPAPQSAPAPAPAPAAASAARTPTSSTEIAPSTADPAVATVPVARIGVACDGRPIEDEERASWERARTANAAALALHSAGDLAASRRAFEGALALDARYDMARFNLACALSRLGEQDAAAREMTTLLELDLPRFLARLRADPDLEALRGAPAGATLEAHAERVREAWERAIASGLPVVFTMRPGDPRAGFMVGGRCVPVTDAPFPTEYAVLDAAGRRIAYISAGLNDAEIEADEVFLLFGAGVVPFAIDPGGVPAFGAVAYPEAVGEPDAYPRWIDASGQEVAFRMETDWYRLAGRRLVPMEGTRRLQPRRDERVPEGFSLSGNRLTVPGSDEPIELGAGHGAARWHSFARRPDGGAIVVASERVGREPEEIGFEQSAIVHALVVDHVDLGTRTVTRLVSEPVHGFVVEHEGDLYVSHGMALGSGGTLRTMGLRHRGFAPTAREELWGVHPLAVAGP